MKPRYYLSGPEVETGSPPPPSLVRVVYREAAETYWYANSLTGGKWVESREVYLRLSGLGGSAETPFEVDRDEALEWIARWNGSPDEHDEVV